MDKIHVFRVKGDHPYPWRFKVTYKGETFLYIGMKNCCETKREAIRRAKQRLKWYQRGIHHLYYQPVTLI